MGSKRNKAKKGNIKQEKRNVCNSTNILEERLVELHAEAYYKALKRIEEEKIESNKPVVKEKIKWYRKVLLFLMLMVFPKKTVEWFSVDKHMYEGVLVYVISWMLDIIGVVVRLLGVIISVDAVIHIVKVGITFSIIVTLLWGVLMLFVGSLIVMSGKTFEKETDSNRIYAYTASILALVSCIVAVVSLLNN